MSGDHNMYGDGTVYRGERSADSAVKTTYTIHELAHAKGVPSIVTNAMLAMGEKLAEAPTPAAQAADSVLEDAARYRWLREGNDANHGAAWHVAVNLYGCEWDAAIDAARKQGGA